jgi:hypothetical protein
MTGTQSVEALKKADTVAETHSLLGSASSEPVSDRSSTATLLGGLGSTPACASSYRPPALLDDLVDNAGGISRPSALTVLRLTTNSNFVGCSTGISAGLAPYKIWPL